MADDVVIQLLTDIKTKLAAADADKIVFLGKVDNLMGLIANYYQVLSGIVPLIIGILQGGPSDSQVLQEVSREVQELVKEAGATEAEIKMLFLAEMARAPSGDLIILQNEGPDGSDVDPKAFFAAAEQLAVALMLEDVYWYRPFVHGRTCVPDMFNVGPTFYKHPDGKRYDSRSLGWFGNLPQPPTDTAHYEAYTTVFDPQMALPAYLNAIEMFLAMAALLKPKGFDAFLAQWQATLKQLADTLDKRYDTLIAGLVRSDVPSVDDFISFLVIYLNFPVRVVAPEDAIEPDWIPLLGPPRRGLAWNSVYGVVDVYGVFADPVGVPSRAPSHIVDRLSISGMEGALGRDETWCRTHLYPWVKDRVALGLMARWKAIYLVRGYDKAWSVMQHLRVLAKQQVVPVQDANRDWSARDLIRVLDLPRVQGSLTRWMDYSISDLVERLDRIAKGTWATPTDDVSKEVLVKRPMSFRDRLAAAAG